MSGSDSSQKRQISELCSIAADAANLIYNACRRLFLEGCVMKLHHVGIAVDDLKSSIPRHKATFNLRQITEIITDPVQKVKVVLLSGDEQRRVLIELIAPLGERSPISKILERENHLYHICFEVDNIDRALQVARRQGAIIVSEPVEAKLYNGKRIAFVYTRDRYLVEFMEK